MQCDLRYYAKIFKMILRMRKIEESEDRESSGKGATAVPTHHFHFCICATTAHSLLPFMQIPLYWSILRVLSSARHQIESHYFNHIRASLYSRFIYIFLQLHLNYANLCCRSLHRSIVALAMIWDGERVSELDGEVAFEEAMRFFGVEEEIFCISLISSTPAWTGCASTYNL